MGYHYKTLSADEKQARAEIDLRIRAAKLSDEFIARHLKYGQIQGNSVLLRDEVIRLGLSAEEISTERLAELLEGVAHQMAVSPPYTESWAALRQTYPYLLINESVERNLTRLCRSEWPYSDFMEPEKLISLANLPKAQGFILSNGKWEAEQAQAADAIAAASAEASARGNAIANMTARYYVGGELRGKNDYERRQTQRLVDAELSALDRLSSEELAAKYDQWKEEQRLKSLSADQVRAEVRLSESKRLATYTRFEMLPAQYVGIGKTEADGMEWTGRLLKSLPSTETNRLKNLYGYDQLTAAIQESAAKGRY